MRVYEAAELLERDAGELAEELGLKSHMSSVPDAVLVDLGVNAPDTQPEVTPSTAKLNQHQAAIQSKANMLRAAFGEGCPRYLEHVSAYRETIPLEYGRVKHLIEKYL